MMVAAFNDMLLQASTCHRLSTSPDLVRDICSFLSPSWPTNRPPKMPLDLAAVDELKKAAASRGCCATTDNAENQSSAKRLSE